MELTQFKSLLSQVNALSNHYKRISQLTGENFNVFKILKLEASEVRLHSAFIAELLDPKGTHGQEDIFLNLFIKSFCFKQTLIDCKSCNVEIEKHTGFINEKGTEGGRIDIIITDTTTNHHIIIENKIYAGDQNNQLVRYNTYSPNSDLIYLTLDGKDPDEKSYGILEKNTHFKCYSYKSDLLKWLELCRKEVVMFPIIRESITQYINLIKYLTNQTINHSMEKELSDLMKNSIEASFIIKNNLRNALHEVAKDFSEQMQVIVEPHGLKCKNGVDFNERYTGFWIFKPEWKFVNIGFQFQNHDKELRYGIAVKKDPDNLPKDLRQELYKLPGNTIKINSWWPWNNYVDAPYHDWSKYEAWESIGNGKMQTYFKEKIEYLLRISDGINF